MSIEIQNIFIYHKFIFNILVSLIEESDIHKAIMAVSFLVLIFILTQINHQPRHLHQHIQTLQAL